MKSDNTSTMGIEEKKTLGERIKGNLSKRWRGVRNLFGNKDAENAKAALEKLRTTAKNAFNGLDVKNNTNLQSSVTAVWSSLVDALSNIKGLCSEVEPDEGGKGRAYAASILGKVSLQAKDKFDVSSIDDFNLFEGHVKALQLIANKTGRASAIPSVIQDAANETSRFYAYAYAYACAGKIHDRMQDINKVLKKEKTLWRKIKNLLSGKEDDFEDQLTVDTNKVAKAIYNQAKNAKIRKLIKTAGWMKYFGETLNDLFGMYTEPEVLDSIKEEINNDSGFENNLNKIMSEKSESLSENLNIQMQKGINIINTEIKK